MTTVHLKRENISHTFLASFFTLIPLTQITIVCILISSFQSFDHNDFGKGFFTAFGLLIIYIVSSILNPALATTSILLTGLKSKKYIPAIILNTLLVCVEIFLIIAISF